MLERLTHPRIFIYKREVLSETLATVKWMQIKRFNKYPEELENTSGYLRSLSPCFSRYIDINSASMIYVIKDTFTQEVIQKIPNDLMNPNIESPKEQMNKFLWVDYKTIRILNREGIELLVDIDNNF